MVRPPRQWTRFSRDHAVNLANSLILEVPALNSAFSPMASMHTGKLDQLMTADLQGLHWLEWRTPIARDVLREVAACKGQALNASAIGRRLDISYHTVLHRIASLETAGLVRVLPSLAGRRPHVLLRDCRLLETLGGSSLAMMRASLTERITTTFKARYFQWEAGKSKRIELVASSPRETVGFRFVEGQALRNRDWAPLRLQEFLDHLGQWLACGSFREARDLLRGCIARECLIQTMPLIWEEPTASLP
jgi:hypothetical protein